MEQLFLRAVEIAMRRDPVRHRRLEILDWIVHRLQMRHRRAA